MGAPYTPSSRYKDNVFFELRPPVIIRRRSYYDRRWSFVLLSGSMEIKRKVRGSLFFILDLLSVLRSRIPFTLHIFWSGPECLGPCLSPRTSSLCCRSSRIRNDGSIESKQKDRRKWIYRWSTEFIVLQRFGFSKNKKWGFIRKEYSHLPRY